MKKHILTIFALLIALSGISAQAGLSHQIGPKENVTQAPPINDDGPGGGK